MEMEMEAWKKSRIIKEMLPLLILLTTIGVFSGLILENYKETLFQYPQLLVLLPVMIGMGGNLGAILASRLSTAFHLGLVELKITNRPLKNNIISIFILSTILFTILGFLTWFISITLGIGHRLTLIQLTLISQISGIILSIIIILITIISSYLTYLYGLDPDNTILPLVSSLGDIIGILIFYLTALSFL